VFSFNFFFPPTLRRRRELGSLSDGNAHDPHPYYSEEHYNEMKQRYLLIGGGSEPRGTTTFDNCQFLNNSLTTDIMFPTLAQNGVVSVESSFVDVTMNNCLFKDNFFDRRRDGTVRFTINRSIVLKLKPGISKSVNTRYCIDT
jgi:hypothetical protein